MDLKKAGSKKQGHCYSEKEEAASSFLINNDPIFSPCFFPELILDLIFFRVTK